MGNPGFSDFELLVLRSDNQLGTAVLLVLAWIAASDGSVAESEKRQLYEIAKSSGHGDDIDSLLRLTEEGDRDAIQLSCEIIKRNFQGERSRLFLEMAISIAIADGYLLPSENHILRFIADLLGIAPDAFNSLFSELTGKPIPEPSDPSKAAYWRARERTQKEKNDNASSGSSRKAGRQKTGGRSATEAYAILGLEQGASKEEIKRAFRRLAQVHHPDRFSSLGDESVAAATSIFRRIKEAHDYLINHA